MGVCQIVMHEIMAFEKMHGKKPKTIVLGSKGFTDRFFAEIYEYTMKTDNLDFKTPGQFYGVPFVWKDITQYGGACEWMLIGGQP